MQEFALQPSSRPLQSIAWRRASARYTTGRVERLPSKIGYCVGLQPCSFVPRPHKPVDRRDVTCDVWPFDQAWGANVDIQSIWQPLSTNFFAVSIIPYAGFLYHLTRSKRTPPIALFGFYFLLVFVFVTIPAGIYAKKEYGQSLANVDWLHGGAESLLTVTNLLIVLGFRQGIREVEQTKQSGLDTKNTNSQPTALNAEDVE